MDFFRGPRVSGYEHFFSGSIPSFFQTLVKGFWPSVRFRQVSRDHFRQVHEDIPSKWSLVSCYIWKWKKHNSNNKSHTLINEEIHTNEYFTKKFADGSGVWSCFSGGGATFEPTKNLSRRLGWGLATSASGSAAGTDMIVKVYKKLSAFYIMLWHFGRENKWGYIYCTI